MRFLCDQMLAGLGRWLRIAGYDTKIIETAISDRQILQEAIAENRILLTRDRHFLEMQSSEKNLVFLSGNSLEEWVQELKSKLNIDWLHDPFSRCLLCNETLVHPSESIILANVPKDILQQTDKFWYCNHCQKIYWQGGHTKRMLTQLQAWKNKIN